MEKTLALAIGSPSMSRVEFCELLRGVPADERFRMQNTWSEYARNTDLEVWRRLAAYQILIQRCIAYPRDLSTFMAEAIAAIGITPEVIVDMTPAHNLPFARERGQKIRMVTLPIPTDVGPAAMYFAIGESGQSVERAAVYPALTNGR